MGSSAEAGWAKNFAGTYTIAVSVASTDGMSQRVWTVPKEMGERLAAELGPPVAESFIPINAVTELREGLAGQMLVIDADEDRP